MDFASGQPNRCPSLSLSEPKCFILPEQLVLFPPDPGNLLMRGKQAMPFYFYEFSPGKSGSMPKLQAIAMDDGTVIFMEAVDTVNVPAVVEEAVEEEVQRGGHKGMGDRAAKAAGQMAESFTHIQNTIKTYTKYTLNAFRDAALADVKKVTLEFGVNVSGEGGVPYIATGTVGCNIKVTVECAFPERQAPSGSQQTVAQRQPHPGGYPQPIPRHPNPGVPPSSNA